MRLADQPALAPIRYEVKAEGYAPSSTSVTLLAAGINVQKVELSEIEVAVELPGTEGGTVKVQSASVQFPPDAFVGQDGFSVQGGVQIQMTTVDPQSDNVKAGPELIAEDGDGNKQALTAMGMVYVSVTDAQGEDIAMMPNRRAALTLAIPASSDANAGDVLALQSYDEERQAWTREGECKVEEIPEEQRADDGRTLWCRGSVAHFSWWAITRPKETVCLNSWFKVEHSQRYVVNRTLQLSWSCWTFGSYPGEYCWLNAGDGEPRLEPSEDTDETVKIAWEEVLTTVVPPEGELPASTCSATGLTHGTSGLAMFYQILVEATDRSDGDKRLWFAHNTDRQQIDTIADRLGSEHMHGFITKPGDICRNDSLCTQVPIVVNLDELTGYETVDGDGDGFFNLPNVNWNHPYASILHQDCDDGDEHAFPGAPEDECATKDMNCDRIVPLPDFVKIDPLSMTAESWHEICRFTSCLTLGDEIPGNHHDEDCDGLILDYDGDRWISAADAKALDDNGEAVPAGLEVGDCDDTNPGANPNMVEESGNPVDEDCDGIKQDADNDEYWTVDQLGTFDLSGGMDAILEFIELYNKGVDCNDDNGEANPGASITVESNPEATFAQYYYEVEGIWHRKPGYCTNFHPDTGLPLIAFRSRLVDYNCDLLYTDLDGDGWAVPGDHTFGVDRAFDCNDLDPRVKPAGAPGSVSMQDCAPMAADEMVNELECPAEAPQYIRDVASARAGEPVCPNTPSGLPTMCVNFVDQDTGQPGTDWGCVFADARASNPPTPPPSAGRLYGACGNLGGLLPPCSEGVCGGPLRYSPRYIDELNKIYGRTPPYCLVGPNEEEICKITADDWLGMCFPRCDKCWGKTCATENQCAISKCNGATGECEELVSPVNGMPCEDGNPCQGDEMCWEGECAYQSVAVEGTACKAAGGENGTCAQGKDAEGYATGECTAGGGGQPITEPFCQWSYFRMPANEDLNRYCEDKCKDLSKCPRDLCNCGESYCGNAVVEGREQCDDGVYNGNEGHCGFDCGISDTRCRAGTYYSWGECLKCQQGWEQPESGQTECRRCQPGYHANIQGLARCKRCEPGTYSPEPGAVQCWTCPAGTYQNEPGKWFCNECPKCGEKERCSDGPEGNGMCVCLDGFRRDGATGECSQCPAGQLGDGLVCRSCPAGTFSATAGSAECEPCPPGSAAGEESTVCRECEPGMFARSQSEICTACHPGTIPNADRSGCAHCPAGTYAAEEGSHECVTCPVGTFQGGTAAVQCEPCPAGHFGADAGASVCQACSSGTYQPSTGQAECLQCPACGPNGSCNDGDGDGTCSCDAGFDFDGTTCSDIDECTSGAHNCHPEATCTNDDGSFSCACKTGFVGDGTSCVEEGDECATGAHNCHENATCTNTDPGFTCACDEGYGGDGVTCTDVDECTEETHNCDANATCTNDIGSFTCGCNAGFEGDGVFCGAVEGTGCTLNSECSGTCRSGVCAPVEDTYGPCDPGDSEDCAPGNACTAGKLLLETITTPADNASEDELGGAVSLFGDTALVGASEDDDKGSRSGSAYVFVRDASGAWVENAKLTASDGAEHNLLGSAVSLSGHTALLGARQVNDLGNSSGAAYVFERDGGGLWIEKAKLLPPDPTELGLFGVAVALSGDTAAIGAVETAATAPPWGASVAYVFRQDGADPWTLEQTLVGTGRVGNDWFGRTLAIQGNTIVVGASRDESTIFGAGAAYVFERDGGGSWEQTARLVSSDPWEFGYFGSSVTVSGDTIAVGSNGEGGLSTTSSRGAVHLFVRDGAGGWSQTQRLVPGTPGIDGFGYSVALDGGTLAVGTTGEGTQAGPVYVFERTADGSFRVRTQLTLSGASGTGSGARVALSEDVALAGAPWASPNGRHSGALYFFDPRWEACMPLEGGSCTTDEQCAEACIAGACAPFSEPGGPCDNDDHCKGDNVCLEQSCNLPPEVSAGDPQVAEPGALVTLSGSADDPEGGSLVLEWSQVSGPTVTLSGAATETATFIAPTGVNGTELVFSLSATDEHGASASAQTTVTLERIKPTFVYVSSHQGAGEVQVFSVDLSNGDLAEVQEVRSYTQPESIALSPNGTFLYTANANSKTVRGWTVDPGTGQLSAISGFPVATGASCWVAAVDPSGRYLYVSLSSNDTSGLLAYSIGADGFITPIQGSPFAGVKQASAIVFAGTEGSRFMYLANRGLPQSVSAFSVDDGTGAPTELDGSPFGTSSGPLGAVVTPSGSHLYAVVGGYEDNVAAWTIDSSSGVLTEVSGSPFAAGNDPESIALTPSGAFVYVANKRDGTISGYAVDAATGVLTSLGAPTDDGGADGLVIEPTGAYLYLAKKTPKEISAFEIDQTTGALIKTEGSPFPMNQNYKDIQATP